MIIVQYLNYLKWQYSPGLESREIVISDGEPVTQATRVERLRSASRHVD